MKHARDNSAQQAVSTKQERIAYWARTHPREAFASVGHNLTKEWLLEAYHRTRKDGAVGVDGVTGEEYAQSLEQNLVRLSDEARSGQYRAPPVRRGYVPKPGKAERRPIGMPAFEDKILQRGVAMVLEPIYEQDFLDCSFGFRPGRSAHQALEAIWQAVQKMGGCWLLEVDIRKFFDTLDHRCMREILEQRVTEEPDAVVPHVRVCGGAACNSFVGNGLRYPAVAHRATHHPPLSSSPTATVPLRCGTAAPFPNPRHPRNP